MISLVKWVNLHFVFQCCYIWCGLNNLYNSLPPPLPWNVGGGGIVNFDFLPWRVGYGKLKKGGGSMVQGQVFLKVVVWGRGVGWWCWHFSNLFFSRFITFTFRNYFPLCKIVLCIWRRNYFFCHRSFMKIGHSKLSKNEPENIL